MDNSIAYKLAQLPTNALFVGVDPHKREHALVVTDGGAHVLARFEVSNDRPGFETILTRCEALRVRSGAVTCIFAVEAGAHHWRNLVYYLDAHQQVVRLINPLTLKRQRDGDDLLRRKNDYRDAEMAAQLLREGKYTWTRLPQAGYAELRAAHDMYQQLVVQAAQIKLQLVTALDGLFPEFMAAFKAVDGQTALAILTTCPNPASIAALPLAEFSERIRRALSGRRLADKKLALLHQLAATSTGVPAGAETQTLAVQLLADRLAFLQMQRQLAEDHLLTIFYQQGESPYLLSIPGLGAVNAAGLLAHIGDIRAYSSIKQLPKLAGIVPTEDSSADHAANRTPMSKKGRPNFRLVLYRSVIGLLRHNETIKLYITRLTERPVAAHPLRKREALGAAMTKVLHIVYALLTKHVLFDPAHVAGA